MRWTSIAGLVIMYVMTNKQNKFASTDRPIVLSPCAEIKAKTTTTVENTKLPGTCSSCGAKKHQAD